MLSIGHYEKCFQQQIKITNTPFLLVNVKIVTNFLEKTEHFVTLHLSALLLKMTPHSAMMRWLQH